MDLKKSILSYPVKRISRNSSLYPPPLLDLFDPPQQIYVRGSLPKSWDKCIGVVGSRKVSLYGRRVTEEFAQKLVAGGFVVVSGFMYGVDVVAHSKVVEDGGVTIAVLAHGLNYFYPNQNLLLYQNILKCGGCIVSEYEPGFAPRMWTFPRRNRIVAALSLSGVLVVEAQLKSGSLITAKFAEVLGRDVMAVPGNIDSENSMGTNNLIKTNAARAVTEVSDITNLTLDGCKGDNFNENEKVVLAELEKGKSSHTTLKFMTGLNSYDLDATVSSLKIRALLGEINGEYFLRKK